MEYIPHILYINLDRRPDRLAQIQGELGNMGLSGERIPAVDTVPHGYIGCTISHINALKKARDAGWENVLILEDDFHFIVTKETLYKQLTTFYLNHKNYDILLFGHNVIHTEYVDALISRTKNVQTTSGYIVHKRFYTTLINRLEEGLLLLIETKDAGKYTIDQYWKELQHHSLWYYFNNRIGIQREGFSDIELKNVNYKV